MHNMPGTVYQNYSVEYPTPMWLFNLMTQLHGPFTLDAAATAANRKCPFYYDQAKDGLKLPWTGRVWCNPPFSGVEKWVKKGFTESSIYTHVAMLLPAWTDKDWFHDFVIEKADYLYVVRGRVKFEGAKGQAPFPVIVAVFRGQQCDLQVRSIHET